MIKRFLNQSLRKKFVNLFMVAMFFIGLMSSIIFTAYEYVSIKYKEITSLNVLAAVIAENSQAAVLFQDSEAAKSILKSLYVNNNIEYAQILLPDKSLFAEYTFNRQAGQTNVIKNILESKYVNFSLNGIDIIKPIRQNNETIGYVYIHSNLHSLYDSLLNAVKIVGFIFLISLIIAYSLSNVIVRRLITPILNLAEFSKKVSKDKNYSYRITQTTNDEIGELISQFNRMLEQIEIQNHKLTQAKEKAIESSKAKERFLANMSHEIRTPLNAIDGMTKLLKKSPLTDEQKEYLSAMETSTANLLVIINDILDISKIEAGQLTVENIGFKPKILFENLKKSLHLKAKEKGIFLKTEFDDNIPEILIGDPVRINQVLINLTNNAIKFTQKGGVVVRAKLLNQSDECCNIRVEVIDTGIGIPEDKLDTVFENFKQADNSTTRKFGGTGLGLSISKKLVTLFGGELKVTSTVNVGSTFYFEICLPVGTPKDLPDNEVNNEIEIDNIEGKKVLLVEDHEINRFLATTVLQNWKMKVDVAENGQIAVDKVKEHHYDVILMDMQMPVMGGVEATKIIRQKLRSNVPIIALTANAIKGDAEKCKAAGMNDYVSKPFDPSDLYNKILTLLNN